MCYQVISLICCDWCIQLTCGLAEYSCCAVEVLVWRTKQAVLALMVILLQCECLWDVFMWTACFMLLMDMIFQLAWFGKSTSSSVSQPPVCHALILQLSIDCFIPQYQVFACHSHSIFHPFIFPLFCFLHSDPGPQQPLCALGQSWNVLVTVRLTLHTSPDRMPAWMEWVYCRFCHTMMLLTTTEPQCDSRTVGSQSSFESGLSSSLLFA